MRRLWALLTVMLLTACAGAPAPQQSAEPSGPPATTSQQSPSPKEPSVEPGPAPAAEAPAPEQPATQIDLAGDGEPERIYLAKDGQVRIVDGAGKELFTYRAPGADLAVYSIPDRPPLVHISWPWCLRSYPANLFIWFDPERGALRTEPDPDGGRWRCGMYEHQGGGRFALTMRNEELLYTWTEEWRGDQFIAGDRRTELLYVELDRLPVVLNMLTEADPENPERLFAPAELYHAFKEQIKEGWRFALVTEPTADAVTLSAIAGGRHQATLALTYKVEGKFKENIVITGLKWLP
ncbi:MAG: hypothetical protein ACOY93_10095 [Bacillota bacterium]